LGLLSLLLLLANSAEPIRSATVAAAGSNCFIFKLNLDRDLPSLSLLAGPELPSLPPPTLTFDNHMKALIVAALFPGPIPIPRLIVSPLGLAVVWGSILIGFVVGPINEIDGITKPNVCK